MRRSLERMLTFEKQASETRLLQNAGPVDV